MDRESLAIYVERGSTLASFRHGAKIFSMPNYSIPPFNPTAVDSAI